ncbi:ISL3 family transposase [Lactobacillus crispatus]|uniref:ISL3 family transposase n=1 Tax=Lactobacillus crispatus TaxID=47770 RepID=UPI00123AE57F|nr:ISL3 family transposase [Lactobacillus crispatus]KAA8780657.1 ISL3 family transposase [Lactobacillus crispatus]KAA8780661.1 ISL3 family transposase [Lactobacillus crispatus]KAA8807025.1 ISL3 family transposase [Lactobacillus crispatus]
MSSYNDCIKFSLNIKDPLLEFLDISIGKYRNRDAKFYHAVAHLDQCLNCGSTNIVHNGHLYSNVRYPALDASLPVFIRVAKQRVICRDCHMNSMAETELVEKYCCISNATKRKIIGSLTEDWSMKSIARQTSTSTNTVQRVLERYGYSTVEDTDWLPEYLAFDEFRGVGRQLHFIAIDGHTHKIVKVLPTRLKKDIINYFKRFPLTVRNKVKTVTMDLNYYYDIMAKELFPNAQVILDRFHIVQMLNRSFNSCRIQEMKKHKKGTKEYNLLKYYWKLYLKPFEDLEKVKPYHQPRLKDTLTQEQVVADGLRLSPELENTYNLMQDISKALRDRDTDKLKDLIKSKDHVVNMMHTTLNTFKRNLHDILNAAKFDESNGCLEGTNRKIKQIERTAYGYANFTHLITRIQLEEKGAIIKEKASSWYIAA